VVRAAGTGYVGGMAKKAKKKVGRPKGTGRYGVKTQLYLSEDMQTRITKWGLENGAASFPDAIRLILAKELGVRP
jgi:hypothetical protein